MSSEFIPSGFAPWLKIIGPYKLGSCWLALLPAQNLLLESQFESQEKITTPRITAPLYNNFHLVTKFVDLVIWHCWIVSIDYYFVHYFVNISTKKFAQVKKENWYVSVCLVRKQPCRKKFRLTELWNEFLANTVFAWNKSGCCRSC